MPTETLFLAIRPQRFHFLKSILEGYDNLAILSMHDAKAGVVRLSYAQNEGPALAQLLTSLAVKEQI